MFYVSHSKDRGGQWGVTDTDDGSVDWFSFYELLEIAESGKAIIYGVDAEEESICVVSLKEAQNMATSAKRGPKYKTRLEFFEARCGFDYIMQSYEGREFNEYVVSHGGDVLTYRVYGTPGHFKIYER